MPRGGRREGAGRKRGVPNKSNADIKAAIDQAADHIELARNLVRIATKSESDQAQVAATRELWDRRFGKATQILSGEGGGPMILQVSTGVPRAE